MLDVRLLTDRVQWNRFISSSKTGHLSQTYEWSEHGENPALRDRALHIGALRNGELVGAVLLLCSALPGIHAPLYYAPRGPVVDDVQSDILPVLMQGAAQLARQAGGFAIRIEPNVADEDAAWKDSLHKLGYRLTDHVIYLRNTWILDVRPSEKELLAGMKTTWRYNINFSARKGVRIREGITETDFDRFIVLLSQTAKREQFYMYPRQVFRDMLDHYSAAASAQHATARIVLLVAEYEGQIIGATTLALFGEYGYSLHTGLSDEPEHRKLKPNYALQWECIRRAKEFGCAYYDFRNIPEVLEEGQPMYGVYEFKKGFGGFFRRMMPTMDLPLNPVLYYPYMLATDFRKKLRERRSRAATKSETIA